MRSHLEVMDGRKRHGARSPSAGRITQGMIVFLVFLAVGCSKARTTPSRSGRAGENQSEGPEVDQAGRAEVGEPTTEEELLLHQMTHGQTEMAREGFRKLLERRSAKLVEACRNEPNNLRELYLQSYNLGRLLWTTEHAQLAEVCLHLVEGTPISEEKLVHIVAAVGTVRKYAPRIGQAAQNLGVPEKGRDLRERAVRSRPKKVGKLLLKSVALFRNTRYASMRGELLAEAGNYIATPGTLEEFDAEYDLTKAFRIKWPRAPDRTGARTTGKGTAPARRRLGKSDEDELLRSFVMDFFRRWFDGDIASLKPMFTPAYWPEKALREGLRDEQGLKFGDLGTVYVRELGNSELEIILPDMVMLSADGRKALKRDHLIIGRTLAGRYEVTDLGSAERRHNVQKGSSDE